MGLFRRNRHLGAAAAEHSGPNQHAQAQTAWEDELLEQARQGDLDAVKVVESRIADSEAGDRVAEFFEAAASGKVEIAAERVRQIWDTTPHGSSLRVDLHAVCHILAVLMDNLRPDALASRIGVTLSQAQEQADQLAQAYFNELVLNACDESSMKAALEFYLACGPGKIYENVELAQPRLPRNWNDLLHKHFMIVESSWIDLEPILRRYGLKGLSVHDPLLPYLAAHAYHMSDAWTAKVVLAFSDPMELTDRVWSALVALIARHTWGEQ